MVRNKSANSHGKMTVMVFNLEGDDATLQDGLRTISNALSRFMPPGPRQMPSLASAQNGGALPAPAENGNEVAEVMEVESSEPVQQTKAAKRTIKSPDILQLDLTSGDMSLKKFLDKHPMDDDSKRYLLIAYWLKSQRDINEVTPAHIHTCFRHMGWQTPNNAAQPLRDMKSKRQWFNKGKEKATYAINHIGENEVLRIIQGNA